MDPVDTYCCEDMRVHVELSCDQHSDPMECPDCVVIYVAETQEYGLPVRDGGSSYILIEFCPWCGRELASTSQTESQNKGASDYG